MREKRVLLEGGVFKDNATDLYKASYINVYK